MQVEQYYSDDYAGMKSGRFEFYYGYEIVDKKNDEWCFQVKENGAQKYILTRSYIEQNIEDNMQLDKPQDYLIAGIGLWLLLK